MVRQEKTTFAMSGKRYWVSAYTSGKDGARFHTVGKCLQRLAAESLTLPTLRTLRYTPCRRCNPLR